MLDTTKRTNNMYKANMYTENHLLQATSAYHKFDKSCHLMSNKAFVLSSITEKMQERRKHTYSHSGVAYNQEQEISSKDVRQIMHDSSIKVLKDTES